MGCFFLEPAGEIEPTHIMIVLGACGIMRFAAVDGSEPFELANVTMSVSSFSSSVSMAFLSDLKARREFQ